MLLQKRFGTLPAEALTRVRAASAAELRAWTERILDAAALDDVLRAGG